MAPLPPSDTVYDLCIVGGGPAGLTLAHTLARTPLRVCLLESGGLEPEAAAQALARGPVIAPDPVAEKPYPSLEQSCRRQLGGNAHQWHVELGKQLGLRYGPLDPIDFQPRSWVPHSGWPLTAEELTPYYRQAEQLCGLVPDAYDPAAWNDEPPLGLPSLRTRVFQFAPAAVFTRTLIEAVRRAENVDVVCHATVTALEAASGRVTAVRVAGPEGVTTLIPRQVVLAAGGIGNPRLLLLSQLGNDHDQVGRYFMDHPTFRCGRLVPQNRRWFERTRLYDRRVLAQGAAIGVLTPTPEQLRASQLLSCCLFLSPRPPGYRSAAVAAAKRSAVGLKRGQLPQGADLAAVAAGLGELGAVARQRISGVAPYIPKISNDGWAHLPDVAERFRSYEVFCDMEQVPDPRCRVTLAAETDPLGCPRPQLTWHWDHPAAAATLERLQKLLAGAVAEAGLGRFEPEPGPPQVTTSSAYHHIGTTRMGNDPRHSVVDPQGRVHGLENLYVAGSSVFPTSGYVNPTLTIVALALRLGAQLRRGQG